MTDKALINQCVAQHCSSIVTEESHNGNTCPVCDHHAIEGAFITIENQHAYQGMICLNCDESWTDVYKFECVIQTQKENK